MQCLLILFIAAFAVTSVHAKDDPVLTANTNPVWSGRFTSIETTRLRLTITATPGDISRIWEVELYAPVEKAKR